MNDRDKAINKVINNFNFTISVDKVDLSKFKGNQYLIKKAREWRLAGISLIPATSSLKRKLFQPKDTAWKEGFFNGVCDAGNKVIRLFKHAEKNFLNNKDIASKFLEIIQQAKINYDPNSLDNSSTKSIRVFEGTRIYLYTLICLWVEFLGIDNESSR